MKSHSLTRRLLAGAAGLMIGLGGVAAMATPASATGFHHGDNFKGKAPVKSFSLEGWAQCDQETGNSIVEWSVKNTSKDKAEITNVVADGPVEGNLAVGTKLQKGEIAAGTQTFPAEVEQASIQVELTWTWKEKKRVYVPGKYFWSKGHWKTEWVEKSESKTKTATVDLTDCQAPPPPVEEEPPTLPTIVALFSCDELVFIVDNDGDAEAIVELAPNTTVSYGPATGFSYSLAEDGTVEPIVDEDASIDYNDEADESNPVVIGPLAPGADPVSLGFEGSAGLAFTVSVTLNGELVEFEEGPLTFSFDEETAELDCDAEGEGGELPVTGISTGLIALGAVVLLAIGGGLFFLARRRRVTFTA